MFFAQRCSLVLTRCKAQATMDAREPYVVVSARRRRERRLRAWWRHEQFAIRCVVACASHHSHMRVTSVATQTDFVLAATYAATASPAATYAATPTPSPVIEYVVLVLAVNYVAPAPVIEYMSSAPVIEHIAPAPAVTHSVPRQQLLLSTPRQSTLLATTSTLPIWCTRNFPFLLLRLLRHRSFVLFLLKKSLMRPCTTNSIRNRLLQRRRLRTLWKSLFCKNR